MKHYLGIIGCGGMGRYHFMTAPKSQGLEVAAVYDIRPERVKALESETVKGYYDLDSFLADPKVDIVVTAVPNNFHKNYAIKALRAGKNVVLEKPATLNAPELAEVMAVAKETGKLLTVHQNRRWDKDFQMVKKTIQEGTLGKVYDIESLIHGMNGKFLEWRAKAENGGGSLLDWAPHLIDQVLWLTEEKVVSVYANLFHVLGQEVDDYFKVVLKFASGAIATVEVGTLCLVKQPRWIVHGTKGSMEIEDFGASVGEIVLDKEHLAEWSEKIIVTDRGPTRTMAPRPKETLEFRTLPDVSDKTDVTEFYTNVMAAIDGEAELLVTPEQVYRIMQIIDVAKESDRLGQSIAVDL